VVAALAHFVQPSSLPASRRAELESL
jgi:hypothetical protein